ncbi:hypothetical protein EOM39_07625 [Candidatus Gracilibacteria bacterium]|nr:hypothetical protein [Candidatus Gracilibacteria bacterium]
MTKIGLDVMGGDKIIGKISGAEERLIAGLNTLKISPEMELFLFGNKELILSLLHNKKVKGVLDIVDVQSGKEIETLTKSIKKGEMEGGVSAGDTGELIKESLRLGRLNINKSKFSPALTAYMPKEGGGQTMILDLGASSSGFKSPEDMIEAYLNNAMLAIANYMAHGQGNPKLGIFNIGVEEYKGPKPLQEVYKLFKEKFGDSFVGNIEGDKIFTTEADIIVTDGFTGNMVLKAVEGTVKLLRKEVKQCIKKHNIAVLLALGLAPFLRDIKIKYNPDKYAGSPILGVDGNLFKSHGSSNSEAIKNALIKSYNFAKQGDLYRIKDNLGKLTENKNEQ